MGLLVIKRGRFDIKKGVRRKAARGWTILHGRLRREKGRKASKKKGSVIRRKEL